MLLFRQNQQLPAPLGLDGIEWPIFALNAGRLHWIMAEKASDAALLTRQVVGNMEANQCAALISDDTRQRRVLAEVAADAGPGELLALTLIPDHFEAMLQRLGSELDRSGNMSTRQILLNLPTQTWERFAEPRLAGWLMRIGAWLVERRATLLIISDGLSDTLSERLLPTQPLSGRLRLARSDPIRDSPVSASLAERPRDDKRPPVLPPPPGRWFPVIGFRGARRGARTPGSGALLCGTQRT